MSRLPGRLLLVGLVFVSLGTLSAERHPAAQAPALPAAPTIGIATALAWGASVTFAVPEGITGASYTVTASPGGLQASGSSSPVTMHDLSNGTIYRFRVTATTDAGTSAPSEWSNAVTPAERVIPALDPRVTWILPSWGGLTGSQASVTAMAQDVWRRIGVGGPRAKVGLSVFVQLNMTNWAVDTTSDAAMQAALASSVATVRGAIERARNVPPPPGYRAMPIGISLITAIRNRTDGVETEAAREDLRNVQWYHDNTPAISESSPGQPGPWTTYSSYARKMRRVKEAYVRAFGRALADLMQKDPDILVAVTGDGEIEMSYDRFRDLAVPADPTQRSWADYSPFAIAEFRDWLRGTGLYAAGGPLEAEAHPDAALYGASNGLAALNAAFDQAFATWDLRYFNYTPNVDGNDSATALRTLGSPAPEIPAGFDAPRPNPVTVLTNTDPFWLEWRKFRELLLHRYNRDFARWITESTDSGLTGVPYDRWYSAQIPTDMLFGNPPNDQGVRWLTSASPHWTADIGRFGGMGVTGYNVNAATNPSGAPYGGNGGAGPWYRTTPHVIPAVAARSPRWGIVEWNPSDPWSSDVGIYRQDNELVRRYRPSLLMPFKLADDHYRVFNSGFEPALEELVAVLGQPRRWLSSITWTTPAPILTGTALSATQLNATASVPGEMVYTVTSGGAPASGAVLPVGTHQITATFTPEDDDYAVVTSTVNVTVAPLPTMVVTPRTPLLLAGQLATPSTWTPAQTVSVRFSAAWGTSWTASADQPWVLITGGGGNGDGQFLVGLTNPSALAGLDTATATITVSASGVQGPTSVPISVVWTAQSGSGQLPSAPRLGHAFAGDRSATVHFRAPVVTGTGPVLFYQVLSDPGAVVATGTASPIQVAALTNGQPYRFRVRAVTSVGAGPYSGYSNRVTPAVRTIPALDPTVTYVLPEYASFVGGSVQSFNDYVGARRAAIGDGVRSRLGLTLTLPVTLPDWSIDTTDTAAVRAALDPVINYVDLAIDRAEPLSLPFGVALVWSNRGATDPVQAAAATADVRNLQWYSDNSTAAGWTTPSRYATRLRQVQEAYFRELGRLLADRMAAHPTIFVAVMADRGVELSSERLMDFAQVTPIDVADYSPYAVAQFRDWLRGVGPYAAGQPLAAEAYALASRYGDDVSPASGGAATFNADFGQSFTTWALRYDPGTTSNGPTHFDAPRVRAPGTAYWDAWVTFRRHMIRRHQLDMAEWLTSSTDPGLGGIPPDRYFSAQVPTDVLFGAPPLDAGARLLASASTLEDADIRPWGGLGIAATNLNAGPAGIFRTLPAAAPRVAQRDTRWALTEWNPGSSDASVVRVERDLIRQYRPSVVVPIALTPGFETVLNELMQRIGAPGGWLPVVTWPTPARVVEGTALSAQQLNAAANVAGGFAYSHAAGHLFGTGTHTLSVTFTPSDPDYAPVTTTVSLEVFPRPTLTLAPGTTMRFSGSNEGGTLTQMTGSQTVTVNLSGPGSTGWVATADKSWVQIANGSGTGSGVFQVGIINPGNILAGVAADTATVTVVGGNVAPGSSPRTVGVQLSLRLPVVNTPPVGQIETPAFGAAGIVGAIPVTGWVVDDANVDSVKIYRNCLSFEIPPPGETGPCQLVTASGRTHNVVFVGDAAFLPGARPDIELAYPTLPRSDNAGWGYLMLTSMLPNVSSSLSFGGQGPLEIYAIASDGAGERTLLGYSINNHDPRPIVLDNQSIDKPFGAIDTPGQGQTVSGIVHNFGWVLTPDLNINRGDVDDVIVPTNGSTVTVYLNGAPVGTAIYNLCRGTNVVNPLPADVYCDDDVASIFGHPTPRGLYAPRASNLTKYRNLDAGNSAIGVYSFDTRTWTNGRYDLAWGVTNTAGRGEGIGSRFFHVLNSGSGDAPAGDAFAGTARASATTLSARPASTEAVWGRTGFNLAAQWKQVRPGPDGRLQIRITQTDRMELDFGMPVDAGHVVVSDELRDLPFGASLTARGFAWVPPAGYLGEYTLAFLRGGERVDVAVVIVPSSTRAGSGESEIRMHLDPLEVGADGVTVQGWAYDPRASIGSGTGIVHVWARRLDHGGLQAGEIATAQPAIFIGSATVDVARPDVAAAMADAPGHAGFTLLTPLASGTWEVTAYVWNERTARWEDARSRIVTVR